MSYPTRGNVKTRFRALLNDPNGAVFTDAFFAEGFVEAYDALFQGLVEGQVPRIELVVDGIHLTPNTLSWNPVTDGSILDMSDYVRLEERGWNTTEKFTGMSAWEELPQRGESDRLIDYVWRNDTFYFVGATTDRELRLAYMSSGTAPTNDNTVITVDGCLTFLGKASAAAIGAVKGYDELAAKYFREAYGDKYAVTGTPGGELKRILDIKVRAEQNTQLAIKPYSVYTTRGRRRVPYVAAQQVVGSGPAQFSTTAGTLTGAINGVNKQFLMPYAVSSVIVFLNGVQQTSGVDYTFAGGNAINMVAAPSGTPVADTITVEAWV